MYSYVPDMNEDPFSDGILSDFPEIASHFSKVVI